MSTATQGHAIAARHAFGDYCHRLSDQWEQRNSGSGNNAVAVGGKGERKGIGAESDLLRAKKATLAKFGSAVVGTSSGRSSSVGERTGGAIAPEDLDMAIGMYFDFAIACFRLRLCDSAEVG